MNMRIIRALFRPQSISSNKPIKKLGKTKIYYLKACIRTRLTEEDYTCRLPKDPKPRVRYKLKKVRIHPWRTGHSKIVWK